MKVGKVVDRVVLLCAVGHLFAAFSCKQRFGAFIKLLWAQLLNLCGLTEVTGDIVDFFAALDKDFLNLT